MEAQRNIEFGESRVVNHMLPAKQHMASKWKIWMEHKFPVHGAHSYTKYQLTFQPLHGVAHTGLLVPSLLLGCLRYSAKMG